MPKKHDPKKREEKRKKERGSHASKKKRKRKRDDSRERTNALRSKPYLSIHPLIHLHLLIKIA